MLPVNKTRGARTTESRIEPGCVVEYQQHGKSIAAIARSEQSGKWALINEQGSDVYLPPGRLSLLPGGVPSISGGKEAEIEYLKQLNSQADSLGEKINLEEAWEVFCSEVREVSVTDIVELVFGQSSPAAHLAVLRTFLNDAIFFKRQKSSFNFEPRPSEIVEELKRQAEAEKQKLEQQQLLAQAIIDRLKSSDSTTALPPRISLLEQLAAFGSKAGQAKEAKQILEEACDKAKLSLPGRIEDKAFALLVKIKHFGPHQNIAAIRYGRSSSFSEPLEQEATLLADNLAIAVADSTRSDLRDLLTVSIDNADTRDIDDALSIEQTGKGIKVGVHITDVSAIIPAASDLFQEALFRATSIYCPDETINMLPCSLSEGVLSLVAQEERPAFSFFIEFDEESQVINREVVRSVIRVDHRLNYDQVDSFLYNDNPNDPLPNSNTEEMMLALYELTSWLETQRMEQGGMQFNRRELTPRVVDSDEIILESSADNTPARKLVSELMVCANQTAALFARDNRFPMIFRAQEAPDTDPASLGLDIPDGPARQYKQRSVLKRSTTDSTPAAHSGLAVEAYVQCTSPIRRVFDLINQQQLGDYLLEGQARYSNEEVTQLINRVEANLSEASEIQRERNRYWLFTYLKRQHCKEVNGIVIRTEGARPLAEIDITYSMLPFYPAGYSHGSHVSCAKRPGDSIQLSIERNDPRTLSLKLVEVSN